MFFRKTKKEPDSVFVQMYAYKPVFVSWLAQHRLVYDQAEDIFQEALLIFFKKTSRPDFVFESKPETYLMGICKYITFNRIRVYRNFSNIEAAESIQLEAELDNIAELVNKEKQITAALKTLENIGDKCYKLITGFYFEKKSLETLCNELQISNVNVAKVQKHRCLEKARNMLQTKEQNYAKRGVDR